MGCPLDSSILGDAQQNDHTNLSEPGGGGGSDQCVANMSLSI